MKSIHFPNTSNDVVAFIEKAQQLYLDRHSPVIHLEAAHLDSKYSGI